MTTARHRKLIAALEALHFVIVFLWIGLFFVPEWLWEGRVTFHYWYILAGVVLQLITGALFVRYAHGLLPVCPLSALTQHLKGYEWNDEKTYRYVFVHDLLERLNLRKCSKTVISDLKDTQKRSILPYTSTFTTAAIVMIQYHLGWFIL